MPDRIWTCDLRSRSYVAVHESSAFWQVFMYDAQNMAVCKTAMNRCGAIVHSCFLCHRENSSQIVVWTNQMSWSSIQQSDLVNKLFHVLNVGIRRVCRRFPVSPEWRSALHLPSKSPASPANSEPHLEFCRDRQCIPADQIFSQQRIFFCHPSVSTFIIASNRPRQTHRVCTNTKATRNLYSWEYNSQAHLPKLY